MKKRRLWMLAFLVCLIWTAGCASSGAVYELSAESGSAGIDSSGAVGDLEAAEADAGAADVSGAKDDDADGKVENRDTQDGSGLKEAASPPQIWVYICGAVANPGVYALPEGSRVYEAVETAGGFLEDADTKSLNQAQLLADGQQITVYTTEEVQTGRADPYANAPAGGADAAAGARENAAMAGKVNLNLADKEQLMTLPGIGEARAEEILRYRQEHGGFSSIEEIQQISGIKEKMFEKIRDYIAV